MKITQLNSTTNMIEDSVNDTCVKILCDPWLDGEEYLGSWAIYPQYNFKPENFSDVDFFPSYMTKLINFAKINELYLLSG